jgi:phenylacetate-CoA ligase
MDIERVKRISRRYNDKQFIKYGVEHIRDKLFIKKYLPLLEKYYSGISYDFSSIREKRLIRTLKYAYKHSKYYRRVFDQNGISVKTMKENWNKVPFLTKDVVKKEIENILAVSINNDYINDMTTTGGSTGQPLGFYILGGCDAEHQEFLFKIIGYKPGDKILAMDGTVIPEDLLRKNIFWIKKNNNDLPYGKLALSSQYLNSKNIHYYVNFLNNFKPNIIRGYPSFINNIANYILQNNIRLLFTLKGVELTSESYYEYQMDNIKRAFNARVFSQYGHAEALIFGYTIDDSMITYCSPLYGYTEIIGDDGFHVKPGQIGEVVATGFFNYAMPFIRYKTGDLALYDCEEDGIVRLKRIYGRTQDYIYTKSMEKILLTALVFARHYKAFQNIDKWQILQNIPGEIIFRIVKQPDFSKEDQEELSDNFYSIAGIKTDFEFVETIPLTPPGKSKFLIQNILAGV